jgi:hypothetical protein
MSLSKRIRRGAARVPRLLTVATRLEQDLDAIKISQGRILSAMNAERDSRDLRDYEFKVFSQWGEDGVIQWLTSRLEIPNRIFIEFGVEDFRESNCRFLMMKDNWKGLVIDGSEANLRRLRDAYYFWRYELLAICKFVTREDIDELILGAGLSGDIGILSIDIDGVDYHVWEAIKAVSPRIVIIEYNSVFGPHRAITVPYDPNFQRTEKHYSNLYFGSSISALAQLGNKMGYTLIGGTSEGVNAFFVRNDVMNSDVESRLPAEAYAESHFRESRDEGGNLSLLTGRDRLALIEGLPVLNVDTGLEERL